MQLTAAAKAKKEKKSGLRRLKTGVKKAAEEAPEESKGGDGSSAELEALRARVQTLETELAAVQSVA